MSFRSQFFIEKLLGRFSFCRSILLTAVLSYFLFFFESRDSKPILWMIPFQIYTILSFYASIKVISGLECVS